MDHDATKHCYTYTLEMLNLFPSVWDEEYIALAKMNKGQIV